MRGNPLDMEYHSSTRVTVNDAPHRGELLWNWRLEEMHCQQNIWGVGGGECVVDGVW
jgi:hypothetical protein